MNTINRYYLLPVGLLFMLASCFKEKPLSPPGKGGLGQTAMIEMGPDYGTQFFYSIQQNKVLSSNSRFAYDLMFDCPLGKYNIWLNTAKFMSLVRTNKSDLDGTTMQDTAGKDWHYELGGYEVDSNAMGPWWTGNNTYPITAGKVYIINMGVNEVGDPNGFIKLKVNNFTGTTYSITWSTFERHDSTTLLVTKDITRNYKYVTLTDSARVLNNIEPDKSTWDFCFTHYTIIFYEPYYLPYQVTGVLTNPSRIQAYVDSTLNYDSVSIMDLNAAKLQTKRDAVGYEWKTYTGSGQYVAKPYYVYFIKEDETRYYKLHFISFEKNGVKGYPTFEFAPL